MKFLDFLEIGQQIFNNLMKSLGANSGTQTGVPGRTKVPTKESMYPGRRHYKPKSTPTHTKERNRRR